MIMMIQIQLNPKPHPKSPPLSLSAISYTPFIYEKLCYSTMPASSLEKKPLLSVNSRRNRMMKNNKAQSLKMPPTKFLDITKPPLFSMFELCCLYHHIQGCIHVLLTAAFSAFAVIVRPKAKPPFEGGFVRNHVLQPILTSCAVISRSPFCQRTAAGKE